MKLEDKFLEKINEYFINEKPQWIIKLAHDLAEIKFKADKDKIRNVLGKCIVQYNYNNLDKLATAMLKALEVEE